MSNWYFKSKAVRQCSAVLAALLLLVLFLFQNRDRPSPKVTSLPITTTRKATTFPFHKQQQLNDCGVACMKMVLDYYQREYTEEQLIAGIKLTDKGMSLLDLNNSLEKWGFKTTGARVTIDQMINDAPLPCIIHWEGHHFVVVYAADTSGVYIADPRDTLHKYDLRSFQKHWYPSNTAQYGFALLLEEN